MYKVETSYVTCKIDLVHFFSYVIYGFNDGIELNFVKSKTCYNFIRIQHFYEHFRFGIIRA